MIPHLNLSQQVTLLEERGMRVPDRHLAEDFLFRTGYHRLSGYWARYQPNLRDGDKTFVSNLNFERMVTVYKFDEELRRLLMNGIALFEPVFKAKFGHTMLENLGSGWHLESKHFRNITQHATTRIIIERELDGSKDPAVSDFRTANPGDDFPVWMAFEVASFGPISQLFGNLKDPKLMKLACSPWDVVQVKLPAVIQGTSVLRNTLAHHGRLWGRDSSVRGPECGYPIRLSQTQKGINNRSTYWWAAMLSHLVDKSAPGSSFRAQLNAHLGSDKTMWAGLGIPVDRDPAHLI